MIGGETCGWKLRGKRCFAPTQPLSKIVGGRGVRKNNKKFARSNWHRLGTLECRFCSSRNGRGVAYIGKRELDTNEALKRSLALHKLFMFARFRFECYGGRFSERTAEKEAIEFCWVAQHWKETDKSEHFFFKHTVETPIEKLHWRTVTLLRKSFFHSRVRKI